MSGPPYRSLSLGLRVMSALIAVGGAFICRPRPGTQRRHPGRAHCGSLHPRHHAAAVSQDARSWQPLSNVFDLGPVAGQAGVGGGSVLRASPGFASQSPIMRECRCVQIS